MTSYNMMAEVDILDVENNNCTAYEVEQLLNIFEALVQREPSLPTVKNRYLLEKIPNAKKLGIAEFGLTIERKTVNKNNRIFDDTEDFNYYTGSFVVPNTAKNLQVQAIVIDNMTQQLI